jgi:hypothetical protein
MRSLGRIATAFFALRHILPLSGREMALATKSLVWLCAGGGRAEGGRMALNKKVFLAGTSQQEYSVRLNIYG